MMTSGFLTSNLGPNRHWPLSDADHVTAIRSNIWHAKLDSNGLVAGTRLMISGGHRRVRLRTADLLQIELLDGQRVHAQLLDRTGREARVVCSDGTVYVLRDCSSDGPEARSVCREQRCEAWDIV